MNNFDFYTYLWLHAQAFALVLVRVGFLIGFLPLFGWIIPLPIKASLILIISLIFTPLVATKVTLPTNVWEFVLRLIPEALLGMSLGLLVRIIFAGVQLGGQLVGFQMGFGVAQVIDPMTGAEAPVLSQMAYLVAILLFLVFDIHHYFLLVLGESLNKFPPGTLKIPSMLFVVLVKNGTELFRLALKLLAPVMAILLLIQIALGMLSRFVPQINVMIVSFPLTIGVGLFFFGLTLGLIGQVLSPAYGYAVRALPTILKAFGGG